MEKTEPQELEVGLIPLCRDCLPQSHKDQSPHITHSLCTTSLPNSRPWHSCSMLLTAGQWCPREGGCVGVNVEFLL